MAYARPYRTAETSTTTGTGSITLAGAVDGYVTFASQLTNGDTCTIVIEAVDGNGAPTGAWEVCDSTFTSPSTLSRGTLRDSSTGSRIDFAAGDKRVFAVAPDQVDIQVFDASANWHKPQYAKMVQVIAFGGGGGGGSGRNRSGTTNAAFGGGGGSGGGYVSHLFQASALASTVAVTVGAGGTGGAAQTTVGSNGNAGNAGGDSSFGTHLYAKGGTGGSAGASAIVQVEAARSGPVFATTSGFAVNVLSGRGASGSSNTQSNGIHGGVNAGGGGGGAGYAASVTTGNAGGLGGVAIGLSSEANGTVFGTVGAAAGANGANTTEIFKGGGGGGGASSTTGNPIAGNAGGNGGFPGGGGGGGSASASANSGAGGNGGAGRVIVITYF